jgi:tripartite-type tricarboxylate transporter receptor subunit TctC
MDINRLTARGVGCALACTVSLLAADVSAQNALAQDAVANFYRGKTITIGVGFTAGGGYDLHARTLARHMGKHIPGNPSIVVKNVPGAAGLVLANQLYNTAPKDGTEFATFDRAIPLEPLVAPERARFDSLKLNWIGSTDNDVSTCFAWHTSPVKTFADVLKRELLVGGTGTGGNAHFYPKVLNAVLGAKFKVIPGYPGSAEVLLAMERGETEGFCSMGFVTLEFTRPQWVRDKKVNQLVQLGITKNKNHPDVPLALDLAKTQEDRQAIEFVVSPNLFARPFVAPPGVPTDRVQALRKAFNATLGDPDYLAEAKQRKMQILLVRGEEIDGVLKRIYSMPRSVMDRVKQAIK